MDVLKTITHKDHHIEVVWTNNAVRFQVNDRKYDGRTSFFNSLADAREAVDRAIQTKARIKANKVAISHKCVDQRGVPMTVIGIHRNDGTVKVADYVTTNSYGSKHDTTSFGGSVYPDRPWVREVLAQLIALHAQEKVLEDQIRKLEVRIGHHYGGRVAIDIYERLMDEMRGKLEAADRAADEAHK